MLEVVEVEHIQVLHQAQAQVVVEMVAHQVEQVELLI